jgi:hypothetical protein
LTIFCRFMFVSTVTANTHPAFEITGLRHVPSAALRTFYTDFRRA